jgi:predicted Zn-dependent protease
MPAAIRAARAGISAGHENYLLLTILGDGLLRTGVDNCSVEMLEVSAALEKAVAARPNYATARVALGSALLLEGHLQEAIEQLEKARQLDPRNPSVYSHLAVAYRQVHRQKDADVALAMLAKLNADQAARINSAPGERKAIPGSTAAADRPHH